MIYKIKNNGFTLAEVIISLSISMILIIMLSGIFVQKKRSDNPFASKSGTFICYKDINANGSVVLRQATLVGGSYKNTVVSKCVMEFPANTNSYSITVIGAGGSGAGGRVATINTGIPYTAKPFTYKFPGTSSRVEEYEETIDMPPAQAGPLGKIDFENHMLRGITYVVNGAGGGSTSKPMRVSQNNFYSFGIGGRGYKYTWKGDLKVGDKIKGDIGKSGNSSAEDTLVNNGLGLHKTAIQTMSNNLYATTINGVRSSKYYSSFNENGSGDDTVTPTSYVTGRLGVKYGKGGSTTFVIERQGQTPLKIVSEGGNGAIENSSAWRYQYESNRSVDTKGPSERGINGESFSRKTTDGNTYKGRWSWYNCPNLYGINSQSITGAAILSGKDCSVDGTNAKPSTVNKTGDIKGTITDSGALGGVSKLYLAIYDDNNDRLQDKKYSNPTTPAKNGSVTVSPDSKTFQFFKNSIDTYQTSGGARGAIVRSQIRAITNNKIEISANLIGNPGAAGNPNGNGGTGGTTCFSLNNNPGACLINASGGLGGSSSNALKSTYQQNDAGNIVSPDNETFKYGGVTIIGKSGACNLCLNNEIGGSSKDLINGGNASYADYITKDTISNDDVYGRGGGSGANYFEFTKLLYSLSVNGGAKMLCSGPGNINSKSQLCNIANLTQGTIKAGQKTGTGGMGSGGAIIIKW